MRLALPTTEANNKIGEIKIRVYETIFEATILHTTVVTALPTTKATAIPTTVATAISTTEATARVL